MAALGQLVVSLTAETAQFRQSLDRAAYQAQKNFSSMTGAAKIAGVAIGAAFSGGAFINAIKSQVDLADEILKTSQKIGVQVEELQKLRYAAELSGVSGDLLTRALSKISSEALKGSDVLNQLGISARDANGNLRGSDEIFVDLADKISQYSDGVGKTAAVSALFGEKIARELIPLLNLGAKGINELKKEAEDLGFVMSTQTAQAAERFNDNLTRLGRVKDSLFAKLSEQLLPALEDFTNAMIQIAKEGTLVNDIAKAMLIVFQTVAVVGSDLGFVIVQLARGIETLGSAVKLVATGEFNKAKQALVDYSRQAEESRTQLDKFQNTVMNLGKSSKAAAESSKDMRQSLEEEAASTEKIKSAMEKLRNEYMALFLTKQELAILDLKMLGANQQQINEATALADAIKEELDAREKSKTNLEEYFSLLEEYKAIYNSTASDVQKVADGEARLLELRERLIIAGYDQIAVDNMISEARLNLADTMADVTKKNVEANKTALAFGDAFSSAFENAIVSGNSLRSVLQGLLQDIIKIALRTAITEPLGKAIAEAIPSFSFGGGKALGGQVTGGTSYLVGEKGPEIFTAPPGGGHIIPNSAMGDGVVVNQTFNISAGVSQTVRAEINNLMPRIMDATKAAVADSRRRGGTFSKAFS